jgi:hypothetical protein
LFIISEKVGAVFLVLSDMIEVLLLGTFERLWCGDSDYYSDVCCCFIADVSFFPLWLEVTKIWTLMTVGSCSCDGCEFISRFERRGFERKTYA